MLHNYGGRRGLYGNLDEMASKPLSDFAASNGTMVCFSPPFFDI